MREAICDGFDETLDGVFAMYGLAWALRDGRTNLRLILAGGSDRHPVYRSSPAAWRRSHRFLNEAKLTPGEGGCRLRQLRAHGWEHRATVWPWQAKCVPLAASF